MSANLEISREGRVLRLTLNRPEKRNALSFALCRELVDAIEDAARDDRTGAILLAAKGKAFSAGMDLDEVLEGTPGEASAVHDELFTAGSRIAKPIVAAVSGPALGGGLGLVANAHIVAAAESSTFGLTEIRVGLWPFLVYRAMVAALGERRTLELSITGRIFSAQEALEWGLVQYVVPAAELDKRAFEIAAGVAAWSPEVIRRGMEFAREARHLDSKNAGTLALTTRDELFRTPDFAEGIRAFREKRPPRWPSLQGM